MLLLSLLNGIIKLRVCNYFNSFTYNIKNNRITPEEKKINEEAINIRREVQSIILNETERVVANTFENGFILGAKSESAKAYHTKGMYSERHVIELLQLYRYDLASGSTPVIGDTIPDWFNKNKKH